MPTAHFYAMQAVWMANLAVYYVRKVRGRDWRDRTTQAEVLLCAPVWSAGALFSGVAWFSSTFFPPRYTMEVSTLLAVLTVVLFGLCCTGWLVLGLRRVQRRCHARLSR